MIFRMTYKLYDMINNCRLNSSGREYSDLIFWELAGMSLGHDSDLARVNKVEVFKTKYFPTELI